MSEFEGEDKNGGVKNGYPQYKDYGGFLMPMEGFNYLSALEYETQPGDVFICTYPKCGTTWMLHIVYLLKSGGEPMPLGDTIYDHLPFLEKYGKEIIEQKHPPPRNIKTHLQADKLQVKNFAKYIYIARNPKDCCVSFYYHTLGFAAYYNFENGKFDDFFEVFLQGKVDFGDYFEHLISWKKYLNEKNVLFLTYENMKKDLKNCIVKVASFLGPQFEEKIKDEKILQKIIDNSSVQNMQKMDKQKQWVTGSRPENMPFIRKGEIGDWKNYFSEEQSRRLDEKFKKYTQGTIFENLWDDVM